MTTTTKINTNIRLDTKTRQQVDEIASQMWLTFSSVVNLLLKKFILDKKIEISLQDDNLAFYENNKNIIEVNEPTENLIKFLKDNIKNG